MPAAMARQVVVVGAGVAVLGLTSFGYLSVAGRVLGPADVVPLATLWVLLNAIGPALFFPLEQEVGRAVAAREALGLGSRPLFGQAALVAAGLLAGLVAVCLLAGRPLSDRLFDGEPVVLLALVLGSAGLCAQYLTRGAFAGIGDFGRYGVQLGLDGLLRLAGAVALTLAASTAVEGYALVLGVAPVLAVVLTAPRPGRILAAGPPGPWTDIGSALGLLVAGTVCAQFVVNAAPVAANLLAPAGQRAELGVFLNAYVLVRVPLLAFAAIQAALLPGLARLAAVDDRVAYHRRLRLILLLVAGVGVLGVGSVAAAGPWLVRLAFGAEFVTTRGTLLPLAAATALYMAALVLSQALIALRGYRMSLAGWAIGSLAFLPVLLTPADWGLRVGLAFLLSAGVATAVLAAGLARRLRGPLVDVAVPRPAGVPWDG